MLLTLLGFLTMSKYRIKTVLSTDGFVEYVIQEKLFFLFWSDVRLPHANLKLAQLVMQNMIEKDQLRKSFKSEIIEGN